MIYDCVIFNSELALLEIRLEFLYKYVDKFIIVESGQTLSGSSKPLYFFDNRSRYEKYSEKIIHIICPNKTCNSAWEYEYFQRDYIRTGLRNCLEDDTIIISDVDEIINLPLLLKRYDLNQPHLIELYVHYYYLNLRSKYKFSVNLISPYSCLKDHNIGNRDNYYKITNSIIRNSKDLTLGWHLSFLFGKNIEDYQNKISSFSHQEYNNDYFLDSKRIETCVDLGIDIFEREYILFEYKNPKKLLSQEFRDTLKIINLYNQFLYKKTSLFTIILNKRYLNYYIKFRIVPKTRLAVKLILKSLNYYND